MSGPRFEDVYFDVYGIAPPQKLVFGESNAAIVRAGRGFIDGFDLTMQTQVGCPAGCLFCYVPSGRMLTPAALRGERGERWGFEVRPKRDVPAHFAKHLQNHDLAGKTIYWSGVTDPYATPAAETRALWELLCDAAPEQRPRRIVVQTRFRPDRDVAIMTRYAAATVPEDDGPPVVVSYSIGTDRDDLIRAWERVTPNFAQRMTAIESLRRAGIWVVPTLSPFGLWQNLRGALEQFRSLGVPYITCLFFKKHTGSADTPVPFLHYLEREYPQLLDRKWQREQLDIMRSVYGNAVLPGKPGFTSLTAPHRVSNGRPAQ